MDEWICLACGCKNKKDTMICRFCGFDDSVNVARYGAIVKLSEKNKQGLFERVEDDDLVKMMKHLENELKTIKEELALLEYEKGKSSTIVDAEKWYRKAAVHGNVDAMSSLINCDAKEIKQEWYQKAAACGNEKAQRYLREYEAIEYNDAKAQREIGDSYYEKGTMSDFAKAVKWYEKAANQGDIEAQKKMGDCCYFGYGIKLDQEKAVEWYEKAASQGDTKAKEKICECCRKLGNDYYNGQGRKKDWQKAKEWYEKAAKQNDAEAQKKLGDCYYYGIDKNMKLAEVWYKKAAEQGDKRAQRMIAVFQSLK